MKKLFLKKLVIVLTATESDFETSDNFELPNDIQTKVDDLDCLVDYMKEKMKVDKREKLEILTKVPKSWSIQKAVKAGFSVSKNKIQKAKLLHDQNV